MLAAYLVAMDCQRYQSGGTASRLKEDPPVVITATCAEHIKDIDYDHPPNLARSFSMLSREEEEALDLLESEAASAASYTCGCGPAGNTAIRRLRLRRTMRRKEDWRGGERRTARQLK